MPGQREELQSQPVPSATLVEMTGIRKSFPGVQAVSNASFNLYAGEIHALVGENGAGKSTLVKILTGVHHADAGQVKFAGRPVEFRRPLDAQRAGMATIYQEFTLVPSLTVAANIFLGHEQTRRGLLDGRAESRRAVSLLGRLGANIHPEALVASLAPAHQQLVEIARALARDASVLVMDEPTAALATSEVGHLFDVLRDLSGRGMGIIFISHRLDEVLAIAQRITVMRDGVTVASRPVAGFTRAQLIAEMVGRDIAQEYPKEEVAIGEVCFEVKDLSGGIVREVSFAARRGEILGIAGLMGAGRTELARLVFGADRKEAGEVRLGGRVLDVNSPREAIRGGVGLLTEDRKLQGLVLRASAKDNFALPNLKSWSRAGWINRALELTRFRRQVSDLGMRVAQPEQHAEELSGGNQQKLLVARWLETDSQVMIFDEPTRGIDVGSKYEMYLLIGRLVAQGKVVIVISSELPELLGICDRILVMRRGRISGEITDVRRATQQEVMALAV